jgi:hypothetical protein
VRLGGFSAGTELCGPSGFCLVLDGATGGNNAFALLALLATFQVFDDERYLDDARAIGRWIVDLLKDSSDAGFGGYFLGFPDEGVFPKTLVRGKSVENNADIFAALEELAKVEESLGNAAAAAEWRGHARHAGEFVLAMFDLADGCFHAGTVPLGTPAGPGIDPTGPRRGDEIVNRARFLDANTFIGLALAHSPIYRDRIDWRRPARCVLDGYQRSVEADGVLFSGFGLADEEQTGPPGIAWEFTGQAVLFFRFVDLLYGERRFEPQALRYLRELRRARDHAPFGDGRGLVASTLQDGADLPPLEHCLSTPFQCIPERVGLAATTWGIFAERELNPLGPISQFAGCEGGPTALCLNDDRFKVRAFWRTTDSHGVGRSQKITAETGYFWFFNPANVEIVVKVLDACPVNGHFWVFVAGLTDVGVELHVEDTSRVVTRTYTNFLGTPFQPIQDTAAFATCP